MTQGFCADPSGLFKPISWAMSSVSHVWLEDPIFFWEMCRDGFTGRDSLGILQKLLRLHRKVQNHLRSRFVHASDGTRLHFLQKSNNCFSRKRTITHLLFHWQSSPDGLSPLRPKGGLPMSWSAAVATIAPKSWCLYPNSTNLDAAGVFLSRHSTWPTYYGYF
jgi:hypothetical protein